jgi:hypothetical protein
MPLQRACVMGASTHARWVSLSQFQGMDPHQMAENIQFFVTQNNLDGADVDCE